ncbi:hypothetical protein L198_06720 [Cryptococcus wingfieldii CBS 7118]|uniref:NmrA-like domain-containing protein n=1 Tax=Cryptococcus wingfieldii CBS 7118 TaxID=1295528 RepID=A0A1E3IIU2_9TREE|nr:hypothetical protein L198_06720 [Cryptococcus wingfieldii CBS 7118]ODN88448.1 hypothetical protein L198_06720 [Cryptococcus wingfieldii CBS 7118]
MVLKVVVFTATGDQGSSVCKYALEAGFEVYGITRNPTSDSAQALAAQGVHLIQGDMSSPSSYYSSLKGLDAAFINADFWAKYMSNGGDAEAAQEAETAESKGAADACVEAGIKHIVYSTLDAVEKGAAPHFESKAAVSTYLKEKKYPFTNLYTCNYFSNLYKFGLLKQSPDDKRWVLNFTVPDDTKVPSYPADQTGKWVVAAWKAPDEWIGKDMTACTDALTVGEMAASLSNLAGFKVDTPHISRETFFSEAHKEAVGEELWLAMKILIEGGMDRDVEASKKVVPDQHNFEAWARNSSGLKTLLGI